VPILLEHFFKRSLSACLRLVLGSAAAESLNTRFAPGASPRIFVIRQHNQLGDMLCVVPLLRALRLRYPGSWISLLASPVNYEPMVGNRYVDEVIKFDKREFIGKEGGSLLRFPGYVRLLRKKRFDIAVVPSTVSTSFTSDLFAFLCGARMRIGAGSIQGVSNPSAFFFNHPRDLDWRGLKDYHQVRRNMDIWPDRFGDESDLTIEITLTEDELRKGKSLLQSLSRGASRVIVYHPGAGKKPNRWPAELFARLADELSAALSAATVITSGPMDEDPVRDMAGALKTRFELIQNQPIRDVASAIRFADLVVSNDTGIMHVAAAVGTPVLSLFGPTDPGEWAPTGKRDRYIRGEDQEIGNIPFETVLRTAKEMLRMEHNGSMP
jgi:ADP-heptose:LPS heptosyltransferase